MNLTTLKNEELAKLASSLDQSLSRLHHRSTEFDSATEVLLEISEAQRRYRLDRVMGELTRREVPVDLRTSTNGPAVDVEYAATHIDWNAWEPGPRTTMFCFSLLLFVVSVVLSIGLIYGISIGYETNLPNRVESNMRNGDELRSFQSGYAAQQFRKWTRSVFQF